jgi:hypothetical protein
MASLDLEEPIERTHGNFFWAPSDARAVPAERPVLLTSAPIAARQGFKRVGTVTYWERPAGVAGQG